MCQFMKNTKQNKTKTHTSHSNKTDFFEEKKNHLTKPLFSHMVQTCIHDGIKINFLVDF